MQLGENCYTARSTRRENCSQRTPLSTTTRLEMRYSPSNNASAGKSNLDHSTVTRVGWHSKGKCARVKKGSVCVCPLPTKKRVTGKAAREIIEGCEESQGEMRQQFVFRNYWFVLVQTEGETTYEQPIPGFDLDAALHSLKIIRAPFDEINCNVQGFAHQREIAVSPIAALPLKTTLHELAHVILGHTASQKLIDSEQTDRNIREVE